MSKVREGALVLADGAVFEGELIGTEVEATSGEVVFNTVLSGYQEVISDPSYAGQIINFTYPHIGNYGVSGSDVEARQPFCSGVIVRELTRRQSNWRSEDSLDNYLRPDIYVKMERCRGLSDRDRRNLSHRQPSPNPAPPVWTS